MYGLSLPSSVSPVDQRPKRSPEPGQRRQRVSDREGAQPKGKGVQPEDPDRTAAPHEQAM